MPDESAKLGDRRKDEFIATLAYELRNPLAPLRYALNVLRPQLGADAAMARVRDVMERQVDALIRLVDDLHDIALVQSGAFELRREHVELAAVIAAAVEGRAALVRDAGLELQVELPDRSLWLEGEPGWLAHLVGNLIDNAIRFTDRGGRIVVRGGVDGERASITVRDSGRGFAPELAGELFELYRTSSRQLGLGIGLALARALAEQHGGTITARSDGEGRGAELVVSLPLSTARVTTVVAPQAPAPAARRFRILITDDNRDAADTLADVMRDLGCEVAVAYDGGQAVEVARSFVPDLVLLDIGMPVLDGYEAARRIRSEAGGRPLSLVALTGWGQADDRQRAREAGFDVHLVKPATFESLRALLPSRTR